MAFAVDLPDLIATDLTSAFEKTGRRGLGAGSYHGPSGKLCFFIVERTKLGGGQSIETSEYPFQGGWESKSINPKVQTVTVTVSICGSNFMQRRNAFFVALSEITDDETPGTIALPSWGRFPVVVEDWEIQEDNQTQRLSTFTITFVRAGLSATQRNSDSEAEADLASPRVQYAAEQLRDVACVAIDRRLTSRNLSTNVLALVFSEIAGSLQGILGMIQAPRMIIEGALNKVQSLLGLAAQGVTTPKVLAQAMFGAYQATASAILDLLHTENLSSQLDPIAAILNGRLNGRKILCRLLSNESRFTVPIASVRDSATHDAVWEAYRLAGFYICGLLIPSVGSSSLQGARDYLNLYCSLEDSLERSDPEVYRACRDLRIAVSLSLRGMSLTARKVRVLNARTPILALASDLGVPESSLEEMNDIEDLHVAIGEVVYG